MEQNQDEPASEIEERDLALDSAEAIIIRQAQLIREIRADLVELTEAIDSVYPQVKQ